MYKVLIAEDEFLVRIGIKSTILESDLPLMVVGDTSNGLSAYDLFIQKQPDIVITDIKMPGLNGIDLIRKIRSEDKGCAIIVISCLEDFNILKQAMENNVSAYLLKATMTLEEIILSLRKAIEDLNARNRYGLAKNTTVTTSIEESIRAFLNGKLIENDLVNQLNCIDFLPSMMIVVFLKGRKLDKVALQSLEEVTKLRFSNICETLSFMISHECLIFLVSNAEKNIISNLEGLQRYIEDTFLLQPIIIAKTLNSEFVDFPAKLKQCYEEKEEIEYFEINHPVLDGWMNTLSDYINMIICHADEDEGVTKIIYELDLDYKKYKMHIENVQKKAVEGRRAFINALIESIEELCISESEILNMRYQLNSASTCKIAIINYMKYLCKIYIKQSSQSIRSEVEIAIQYINEHFMEPLTLNKVASIVGLTANYFSNIFKKEVGQSFISYLNKIRIEKAKQLLLKNDLLVYEVAHRVGFEDETYFCRMFKKITGKSPREWRAIKNRRLYEG